MSENAFEQLRQLKQSQGGAAVFDGLASALREKKDYHKLFDALCLKKKYELGAPLLRPTSFDDVPESQRDEFEKTYVAAAREVGQLLLADQKLSQAFVYFHAIRDTQPLRDLIEAAEMPTESSEASEEIIDLGFYKLVHPVKGMRVMLKTHGTCSTITALDQAFVNLSPEQRCECAALLVNTLHGDLLYSVTREVQQRIPLAEPAKTLRQLIAGREWLFEQHNYHIDVSHLHSTVRFARSLTPDRPELALARDLAEYGRQLSPQFQYPGEPPFSEFYPAHIQFFKYLANDDRAGALAWFQSQLDAADEPTDRAMIAYVMVDLLTRTDQLDAALPIAETHLLEADRQFGDAFAELCLKAGRMDILLKSAENRSDLVTYASALVQQ